MKDASPRQFKDVTLLVTHYNRSRSLANLLQGFQDLNCSFGDIVVSDDGSKPEHQDVLRELSQQYSFRLITTPKNRGLANNINKGQDAVKTPFTLYVQEDFVPKPGFPDHFPDALELMREDPELDIVRLYAYFPYSHMVPFKKGFSKMIFRPELWHDDHLKFYYYSDHPHLRRSNFFEKFGRYQEGTNSDAAEFSMCLSFLKHQAKGLFFNDFTSIFDQVNTSSEPSTATFRSDWKQRQNPLTLALRWGYLKYRFLKNTLQLRRFK